MEAFFPVTGNSEQAVNHTCLHLPGILLTRTGTQYAVEVFNQTVIIIFTNSTPNTILYRLLLLVYQEIMEFGQEGISSVILLKPIMNWLGVFFRMIAMSWKIICLCFFKSIKQVLIKYCLLLKNFIDNSLTVLYALVNINLIVVYLVNKGQQVVFPKVNVFM